MKGTISINLREYLDEKTGLLTVREWDNSKLHQSWKVDNGKIIAFECILEDYPTNVLLIFNDITEYIKAIKCVNWINNKDLVLKQSEELTKEGFPFSINT